MNITGYPLAELMDDPLIGLIMKSDRVDRCELELLLERAARVTSAGAAICRTPVNHRDNKGSGPRSVLKSKRAGKRMEPNLAAAGT